MIIAVTRGGRTLPAGLDCGCRACPKDLAFGQAQPERQMLSLLLLLLRPTRPGARHSAGRESSATPGRSLARTT